MLSKIINDVSKKIEHIVISGVDLCDVECADFIADARDAAFFAMGLAIKKREPVLLVVDGEHLTNTYTAVTEAWFQKANVIIVSVYYEINKIKTSWLDRCILESSAYQAENQKKCSDYILHSIGKQGPVLLNILANERKEMKIDYSKILNVLDAFYTDNKEHKKVKIYNGKDNVFKSLSIENISKEYNYGLISKYIASTVMGDDSVFCCNMDCLLLDLNIFRTKYLNSNVKIIALENEGFDIEKLNDWIASNGLEIFETDLLNVNIVSDFLNASNPAILFVKE